MKRCPPRYTLTDTLFPITTLVRSVNDDLAVVIVEDIKHLFGPITVIDVHMRQTPLEAGRHQRAIFGSVAHIEGDLRAIADAALAQPAGDIVRARRPPGPGADTVSLYPSRRKIGRAHV